MNEYTLEFTMEEASDPAPRLAINLGRPNGVDDMGAHKVYFDNFNFECIDDSGKVASDSDAASVNININQLGYLPDDKKTAIFRDVTTDTSFDVINVETGEIAFSGEITGSVDNSTAGETNSYGDFSELTASGRYKITTDSLGESYEFEISENVYDDAFAAVVKMLYLQRCGTELPEEYAGDFAHAACHTAEATIFGTSTKIDVSGGWHDAGDYGRYVVPGAKTVADLILAYQENPSAFSDAAGIPESGNGIPDILDEIKYELDWLLKMQDSSSGGVYHKVSCANFPGMVMPETETDELIVSPISDAATADFAAVMAMSSSVFKKYSDDYSGILLEASKKAWAYVDAKSTLTGFTNPNGIVTGEYGDTNVYDEVFWAAAELFKATGDSTYNDYIKQNYSSDMKSLGWAAVGSYGVYAYLTTDSTKVDKTLFSSMKNDMLSYANKLVSASKTDGYMISLTEYPWGSNMTVANNAMLMILADKISPNEEYIQYATEHFNYIFGANPMSYCYVTGFGSLSPEHTHHRPSEAVGSTMPGMLVGGPNQNLEDPYAQSVLAGEPPAKCYADNSQSYSCNEITIYWNSPLIFVMSSVKD
jgi:endoglucanase